MGNIIKINMYIEIKRKKNNKLDLKLIEKVILEYNNWIKKTNREDKIETYEEFLQAQ
jgi:tRNA splicing endonuclease